MWRGWGFPLNTFHATSCYPEPGSGSSASTRGCRTRTQYTSTASGFPVGSGTCRTQQHHASRHGYH